MAKRDMSTIELMLQDDTEQPNTKTLAGIEPDITGGGTNNNDDTQDHTSTPDSDITPSEEKPEVNTSTSQTLLVTKQVLNNVGGVWKNVKSGLENIPTPGSIMLPLLMLLIFFMLLLPVNGKTRFSWLWSVITGNATISGEQAGPGSASADFGYSPPQTTTPTDAQTGIPTITLTYMTGVEDI